MPFYKYRPLKQYGKTATRRFKRLYLQGHKQKLNQLYIPQSLLDADVRIEDPNDPDFPVCRRPRVTPLSDLAKDIVEEGRSSYVFDATVPFVEGVKQALNLCKAVPRQGLPSSLLERASKLSLNREEFMVHRAIMLSQQWDTTLAKLPKRIHPVYYYWNYDRYYGIPEKRKTSVLLENLLHLSRLALSKSPEAHGIRTFREGRINVVFERGPDLIRSCFTPPIALLCPFPASVPYASSREVQQTANEPVPDVHPVSPLIDLAKEDTYGDGTTYPQSSSFNSGVIKASHEKPSSSPHPSIHTILLNHEHNYKYPWTSDQRIGGMVMQTLSAAIAVARMHVMTSPSRGGQEAASGPMVLPTPVIVNGIQCCRNMFDFATVQLNTLDLTNDSGVKNIVWIDGDNSMFKLPDFWEEFNAVEDYNPDVFRKFLALASPEVDQSVSVPLHAESS